MGLYFQTQLFSVNKDSDKLRSKFARDYAEVTLEQLPADLKIKNAVSELERLQRRIKDEKKGKYTDEKPISSNLTLVLKTFNECAVQTNLNIDTITVTTKDITIMGDTSNRQKTLKFFESLKKSDLENMRFNFSAKGGRDNFNITVAPKT